MLLNANKEIQKLKSDGDKVADKITGFAGTMNFVYIHSIWFGLWILVNIGLFGASLIFDQFPFGLLTLIVSLAAEIRSELDYQVNVKAEKEVDLILKALERLAQSQGIKIDDLQDEFKNIVASANSLNASNL